MNRSLGTFVLVLTTCVLGQCAESLAASSDIASDTDAITLMIAQLGDEQYSVRHRAEQQLIELGTAAFDQLLAAEYHPDLEVASRASYILPRLRIKWVRDDDPAAVRKWMRSYGKMSQAERRETIKQLAAIDDDLGWSALCRVARYDAAPTIARAAAIEILSAGEVPADREALVLELVEREAGDSRRVPVQWIRRHVSLSQPSVEAESGWLGLIDAEILLHKKGTGQTNAEIAFGLLKYALENSRRSEGGESAFEPLRRMIDLRVDEGGAMHTALVFALSWSTEAEQWEAIKQLEDRYASQLREDRLLLYMVAESAQRKGDSQRSKEIAERAYQLEVDDIQQRYQVASTIAELGRHDWAEREWQYVIDHLPAEDLTSFSARREIATTCLFDRREYQQAANLVGESIREIEKLTSENQEKKRQFGSRAGRRWLGQFRAQRDYFLACQVETKGNYALQRKLLDSAYLGDKENPDILIAMYRLQGADEAYKKLTRKRIQLLAKKLGDEIEGNPSSPFSYNHWAWLISNTEGDFQKAVAYSHRSLEVLPEDPSVLGELTTCYYEMRALDLVPDSPSYLDTLGRCYYAAGDLDTAIKYQRQAIRRHPHLQVMRRQLAFFERELAARSAK